jgi:chromosome segregation ATPase
MTLNKLAFPIVGMTLAMAFCAVAPHAYANPPQQDSIVEAARKAREQQKSQKPAKVYTNEDISQLKGAVSVVGQTPAESAPTDKAAAAAPGKTLAPEETPKDEASWRQKFAEARKMLAEDSKELDILQREFNLKQQQFYSDPNVALREQNSRKDLEDTQAKIDAKKADVEKDGQLISELQDALRKAGGDPGWATEPSNGTGANPAPGTGSNP